MRQKIPAGICILIVSGVLSLLAICLLLSLPQEQAQSDARGYLVPACWFLLFISAGADMMGFVLICLGLAETGGRVGGQNTLAQKKRQHSQDEELSEEEWLRSQYTPENTLKVSDPVKRREEQCFPRLPPGYD